jgi:hypothetical protein
MGTSACSGCGSIGSPEENEAPAYKLLGRRDQPDVILAPRAWLLHLWCRPASAPPCLSVVAFSCSFEPEMRGPAEGRKAARGRFVAHYRGVGQQRGQQVERSPDRQDLDRRRRRPHHGLVESSRRPRRRLAPGSGAPRAAALGPSDRGHLRLGRRGRFRRRPRRPRSMGAGDRPRHAVRGPVCGSGTVRVRGAHRWGTARLKRSRPGRLLHSPIPEGPVRGPDRRWAASVFHPLDVDCRADGWAIMSGLHRR